MNKQQQQQQLCFIPFISSLQIGHAPLTCAQQHFAFAQVRDSFRHFAETLLRQVRGVGEDDVEALRSHAGGERQWLAVVVEDKVGAVGGEAAVVFKHGGRHSV